MAKLDKIVCAKDHARSEKEHVMSMVTDNCYQRLMMAREQMLYIVDTLYSPCSRPTIPVTREMC